jgi:hypothetical protein
LVHETNGRVLTECAQHYSCQETKRPSPERHCVVPQIWAADHLVFAKKSTALRRRRFVSFLNKHLQTVFNLISINLWILKAMFQMPQVARLHVVCEASERKAQSQDLQGRGQK